MFLRFIREHVPGTGFILWTSYHELHIMNSHYELALWTLYEDTTVHNASNPKIECSAAASTVHTAMRVLLLGIFRAFLCSWMSSRLSFWKRRIFGQIKSRHTHCASAWALSIPVCAMSNRANLLSHSSIRLSVRSSRRYFHRRILQEASTRDCCQRLSTGDFHRKDFNKSLPQEASIRDISSSEGNSGELRFALRDF